MKTIKDGKITLGFEEYVSLVESEALALYACSTALVFINAHRERLNNWGQDVVDALEAAISNATT